MPEFPAVTYDGQWGGMLLASSGKCASCLTSCEVQVNLPQPSVMQPQSVASFEAQVQSLGWDDPLEKEMATHSRILAWKILWMKSLAGYSP